MSNGRKVAAPGSANVEAGLATTRAALEANSVNVLASAADTASDTEPNQQAADSAPLRRYKSRDGGEPSVVNPAVFPKLNALSEDMIGGATGRNAQLLYPNISSCLGVLCVMRNRITGMHLTVGSLEASVESLVRKLLKELNQGPIVALYFFGPLGKWNEKAGKVPAKLSNRGGVGAIRFLKERLGYPGQAWLAWQEPVANEYCYRATRMTEVGVTLERASAEAGPFTTLDMASTVRIDNKDRPVFELI